jgi:dUTP pyrophosphatase
MELRLSVKRLRECAHLPEYATAGAAGLDLYACLDEAVEIPSGEGALIPSGVAIAIPDGMVGLVRDRSSLAVQGLLTVAGVIDSDYRGEVMVAVRNAGKNAALVLPGQRVAQMLIVTCPQVAVDESAELPSTVRGTGGFGSTGR